MAVENRSPVLTFYREPDSAFPDDAVLTSSGYTLLPLSDRRDAEETLVHRRSELILISMAEPDAKLLRYAAKQAAFSGPGILFLVPEAELEKYESASDAGVLLLPNSIGAAALRQTLRSLLGMFHTEHTVRISVSQLQTELSELKLIQRAKLLLVTNLHMTEAQAHRYIEKTAMDSCSTRRDVAETILKTYSN